jgi:hypothetical protein
MKPEVNNSIEFSSVANHGPFGGENIANLERPSESGPHSLEKKEIKLGSKHNSSDVELITIIPQPVVGDNIVVDNTTSGFVASDSPVVAADDDLIEREWVDKAKKIISQTKNDPNKREEDVSRLQVDYLMKRYGRKIGESDK